ncbi:MAG: hypothetical protein RL134_1955 [Actinomycetota bacterium]
MSGVNLMAKGTVHAAPQRCTQAVMDEVEGRSSWWHPHLLLRHRPATPHDGVGLVVDAIGNPVGRPDRMRGTTRWAMRLDGYTPGREMRWTYIEGHYLGWAIWEFSDMGDGRTRISVVGEIHPAGWNHVRALFTDYVFEQMRIIQHGIAGLNRYLSLHDIPQGASAHGP